MRMDVFCFVDNGVVTFCSHTFVFALTDLFCLFTQIDATFFSLIQLVPLLCPDVMKCAGQVKNPLQSATYKLRADATQASIQPEMFGVFLTFLRTM